MSSRASDGQGNFQRRVTLFSPPYDRMIHPGLMSNKDGTQFCAFTQDLPIPSACDSYSAFADRLVQKSEPERYESLVSNPASFREKGALVVLTSDMGTGISGVTIGTNPQKLKNHRKVIEYLETNLLKDPYFFEQTPEAIVEAFKTTHRLMTEGLPDPDLTVMPGKFRVKFSVVTREKKENTMEELARIMRENGATQADIHKYKKLANSYKEDGFNPEELRLFKFLGHVGTDPKDIHDQMLQLAIELKVRGPQVVRGEIDPVETAAWLHQKLGEIHPFGDGNGRLARDWMNAILLLNGLKPVVFPDDDAYTQAITDDQKGKRPFVEFLREIIDWNVRQEALS